MYDLNFSGNTVAIIENTDEKESEQKKRRNSKLKNNAGATTIEAAATPQPVEMQSAALQQEILLLQNVPFIQQMPELARGCEVTSLAMMLQYAGVQIDKNGLGCSDYKSPVFLSNGMRGNPNDGFVGNIYTFSENGYGVYHGPIASLAEQYLPGRIKDLSGLSIESVYEALQAGTPVLVITNSTFSTLDESELHTWQTASGPVQITYREHSVLVTGYDQDYVYMNDPLAEQAGTKVSKSRI
ncbi:C39 family peptidase [Ectobacillus funiculus]